MANLDEFVIQVKLQTDQLNKDMAGFSDKFNKMSANLGDKLDSAFNSKRVENQFKKSETIISSSVGNIGKILTGGLAGLGAVLGVKFATDFITSMSSKAHGMQFAAQAFGTDPKQLQLLQEVYKRTGSTAEAATQQISQLYQRIHSGQLDQPLSAAVKNLGIDLQGGKRDPVSVILEALKKIGKIENPTQRGALVNMLGLGAEGLSLTNKPEQLDKYIKSVQDNLLSKEQIDKFAEVDRQFQDLGQRWTKIQAVLAEKILPSVQYVTSQFEKLLNIKPENLKIEASKGAGFSNYLKEGGKNISNGGSKVWDMIKDGIAMAETSGGLLKQKLKADVMGAYGTYGLRLSTANDQLNFEKKTGRYDKTPSRNVNYVTADELRANNYKMADEIAPRYFERFNKAYGTEEAIKRYHGNTNPEINESYKQKVLQNSPVIQMPNSSATNTTNNKQVSYNVDSVYMNGVNDMQGFIHEINSLSNTAYNSSRNQIA